MSSKRKKGGPAEPVEKTCVVCKNKYYFERCYMTHNCLTCKRTYLGDHHECPPPQTCEICNTQYIFKKCPTQHHCPTCNRQYYGNKHKCPPLINCNVCKMKHYGQTCPGEKECVDCRRKCRGERCQPCEKKEKSRRAMEERKQLMKEYFAVPGVAYECPVICFSDEFLCEQLFCSPLPAECNRISFCTEPLTNDDLLQGSYDVVFYKFSSNMNNESFNRTVKGKVEFSMKSRRSDSALHIHLNLTDPFLQTSGGKYIEVNDQLRSSAECLHTEKEFFSTIFPNQSQSTKDEDFDSALGRRNFVTRICYHRHKGDWWNELHESLAPDDDDDDDYWSEPSEYWGFALKRISKRVPLGISRDHPRSKDLKLHDLKLNTSHILQKPDCNEIAEDLIVNYRDGSNSWMCTHLQIPSSIAFQIRAFITPPPVFYLEEGDLVLYGQFADELDKDENLLCKSFIIRKQPC